MRFIFLSIPQALVLSILFPQDKSQFINYQVLNRAELFMPTSWMYVDVEEGESLLVACSRADGARRLFVAFIVFFFPVPQCSNDYKWQSRIGQNFIKCPNFKHEQDVSLVAHLHAFPAGGTSRAFGARERQLLSLSSLVRQFTTISRAFVNLFSQWQSPFGQQYGHISTPSEFPSQGLIQTHGGSKYASFRSPDISLESPTCPENFHFS